MSLPLSHPLFRPSPPQVLMENYPSWLLAGEVCQVPISFINCGWKDLQNIYLATSLPEYFTVIRGVVSVRGKVWVGGARCRWEGQGVGGRGKVEMGGAGVGGRGEV